METVIPVRNIYFLLCYAWNRLDEGQLIDLSSLRSTQLVDLFACVLTGGINHLLRRGLHQDYQEHIETLSTLRGRIDVPGSARRMLLARRLATCTFDELSVDCPINQILRSTVRNLLREPTLDDSLRSGLRNVYLDMRGVRCLRLSNRDFRTVQVHRSSRFYRFLLNVCELIHQNLLIDERSGDHRFRDFLRDERKMARLFEDFVFRFYQVEAPDWKVTSDRVQWTAESLDGSDMSYLPSMKTDISLRRGSRSIVIDTKYYKETFQRYYERKTVHSGNLYQVFAYLKNLEDRGGADANAEGMLLYPVVSEKVRLSYQLANHKVRICTVDLGRDWPEIREELLELAA